jgi:hypothetical protein
MDFEQSSPFPPFLGYQDTFTLKLSPDMFTAFTAGRGFHNHNSHSALRRLSMLSGESTGLNEAVIALSLL